MLDVELAGALFHALPPDCSILMVGDDDQLPSVGPGAVLHDLLRCPRVPRVTLGAVFRQDPSGDIARNAKLINAGRPPSHMQAFGSAGAMQRAARSRGAEAQLPSGCVMVEARDELIASDLITGGVLDWLKSSGYDLRRDIQILSPMKRGAAGTTALNRRLKLRLNPLPAASEEAAVDPYVSRSRFT